MSTMSIPKYIEVLFLDYKNFVGKHLAGHQSTILSLLPFLKKLRDQEREFERREAPEFNIFRVLEWEQSEVRTHSALLAQLFDPKGSHGQGGVFLQKFLSLCVDK